MTEKTFEEYFPTFAKEVKNEGMRHYLLEKLEGIDKQKVREAMNKLKSQLKLLPLDLMINLGKHTKANANEYYINLIEYFEKELGI